MQTSLKTKSVEAEPQDVLTSAEQRRRDGVAIAKRIWNAGVRHNSNTACARAVLVGRCSDPDNVWTCDHLLDAEGRQFGAFGVKSSCGSLLCPFCIKTQQRRCSKRLVAARDEFWRTHDPEDGKRERFITLTAPTIQGIDEHTSERIYNKAYTLLSDCPFYSERMDAGAKHVEFTITPHGFNTHIHLLIYGRFMEVNKKYEQETRLRREELRATREAAAARGLRVVKDDLPPLGNLEDTWTGCIEKAARKFGYIFDWRANYDESLQAFVLGAYSLLETREGIVPEVKAGCYSEFPPRGGEPVIHQPTRGRVAGVNVKLVREKGQPSVGEVGLTKAIKEVTKYITKAASWSDIPDEHLVKIAEVRRWPRRFELLGLWRKVETEEEKTRRKDVEAIEQAKANRKLVQIMPGENWVDFTRRVESEGGDPDSYVIGWDYLAAVDYARVLGRHEEAARLKDSCARERGQDELKAVKLYFEAVEAAKRASYASLDTDFISRSEAEADGRAPPDETPKRQRQKSLMALSDEMPLDEWQKIVSIRLAGVRQTRTGLLARGYGYAIFKCLDGSTFEGISHQADRRESRMEAIYQTWHGQY